ncbi:MAG: reprolysin-like metallopeptidase, partial [Pyrinomonadaceae bacterium]
MRRITPSLIFVIALMSLAVLLLGNSASADRSSASSRQSATNPWSEVDSASLRRSGDAQQRLPYAYRTFRVNIDALKSILAEAPLERTDAARNNKVVMALPKLDGSFAQFRIVLSPIMEPELAARFPSIRTFSGQGIDDPTATTRFDLTPTGLHAIVLSEKETFYVEPYTKGNTVDYMVFSHHDAPTDSFAFQCDVTDKEVAEAALRGVFARDGDSPSVISGDTLRTYRLAVGVTAEYTAAYGSGTVGGSLSAITTTLNLANAAYERDLTIRLTLVGNETSIIYTDTTTDGYTHESIPSMLTENQTKLDTIIGAANYDIGHVFDGTILGGGFSFQGQAGAIGN